MANIYPIALQKFKDLFSLDSLISNVTVHGESKEYAASHFLLNNKRVEFRLAKITPKKVGAFVTIWKRDKFGITRPFCETDKIDYIIVVCETEDIFGVFVFPKSVLLEKKIITANGVDGKRGIRVYPTWDIPNNPQSRKTQEWQIEYFTTYDKSKLNFASYNLGL